MKFTILKIMGVLFLAIWFLTCQKQKQPELSATVYLFNASHLAEDNSMPLFPGETSVQTIHAVLHDSEEIITQLRQAFGYTLV